MKINLMLLAISIVLVIFLMKLVSDKESNSIQEGIALAYSKSK